jgi:hypothetical protein
MRRAGRTYIALPIADPDSHTVLDLHLAVGDHGITGFKPGSDLHLPRTPQADLDPGIERLSIHHPVDKSFITLRQQRLLRYPESGGVLTQGQGSTPKHTRAQLAFGVRDTSTQ